MISGKYRSNKKKTKQLLILLSVFLLMIAFRWWEESSAFRYNEMAGGRLAGGDYNGALRDYYYADKLNDGKDISYLAKVERGKIFFKFGKYDEAEKELLDAADEDKRNYRAYEILGDLSGEKGEFDKAIGFFNNALQYNDGAETHLRIGIKRAKAFLSKGETGLAEKILKDLYDKMPGGKENDGLLFYIGIAGLEKRTLPDGYLKKLEVSREYKSKAEKVASFVEKYNMPDNGIFADAAAASLFNEIGEPYLAINRANKAIKNDENYRDAWITLGKSHFIVGDYSASLADFKKAIGLDPHNEEIHFWLGSIFEKTGNEFLASEHFGIYRDLKR